LIPGPGEQIARIETDKHEVEMPVPVTKAAARNAAGSAGSPFSSVSRQRKPLTEADPSES
jgi:hypothetical protein